MRALTFSLRALETPRVAFSAPRGCWRIVSAARAMAGNPLCRAKPVQRFQSASTVPATLLATATAPAPRASTPSRSAPPSPAVARTCARRPSAPPTAAPEPSGSRAPRASPAAPPPSAEPDARRSPDAATHAGARHAADRAGIGPRVAQSNPQLLPDRVGLRLAERPRRADSSACRKRAFRVRGTRRRGFPPEAGPEPSLAGPTRNPVDPEIERLSIRFLAPSYLRQLVVGYVCLSPLQV